MSISSAHALIFHQTPTTVIVGLSRAGILVAQATIPYREASKELILAVNDVLTSMSIALSELTYIACNIGPAPFTTLRTVVVTVNGLGFATDIPLIGVNGLLCLAQEVHHQNYQRTYAINNAFGSEVYYAVYDPAAQCLDCQVLSYNDAVNNIASYYSEHSQAKIQIVGSAVPLYQQNLREQGIVFDSPEHPVSCASLEKIAAAAHHSWNRREWVKELTPYYGKIAF